MCCILKLIYFNWRLITSQYCSGFCHIFDMNQPWVYMCSPSWTPLPPPSPGSSQCASPSTLSHASNLGWRSVSHMIILFQCYSLKSSHPRLLQQSPKDCSLHLCLFCCLAYRVIVTIFLNSIYMRILYWCFSFWLISLCIIENALFLWPTFQLDTSCKETKFPTGELP